jgi:hypothetical protein
MRNRFTDALHSTDYYDWHVNHDTEEENGRDRQITHSARTDGMGLVRQQGFQEPFTFRYTGVILHLAQFEAMWHFYQLCESRTIHFRDFYGDTYEVLITTFNTQRVRGRNFNDPAIPLHYYRYTIEMEVIQVLSGTLSEVGP